MSFSLKPTASNITYIFQNTSSGSSIDISEVIVKTYQELTLLSSQNSLIIGQKYLLNDFQTTHNIIDGSSSTLNTLLYSVPTEPLILTAVSTNGFDPFVQSTVYPNDIIKYTINNIYQKKQGKSWTSSTGAQKGIIYYREDTVNNIIAYYDWREVRFRRWKVNYTDLSNTPFSYQFNTGSNDYVLWDTTVNTGKDPRLGITSETGISFKATNSSDFIDYKTFLTLNPNSVWNVFLGPYVWNTVFISNYCPNVTINNTNESQSYKGITSSGSIQENNTILGSFAGTYTGAFRGNIFFGNEVYANVINGDFVDNVVDGDFFVNQVINSYYKTGSSAIFNGIVKCTFFRRNIDSSGNSNIFLRPLIRSKISYMRNCIFYNGSGGGAGGDNTVIMDCDSALINANMIGPVTLKSGVIVSGIGLSASSELAYYTNFSKGSGTAIYTNTGTNYYGLSISGSPVTATYTQVTL
jgi:hypothetical protein